MKEEMNMKINQLPAKTFGWLHMNATDVSGVTAKQTIKIETQKPESVVCVLSDDKLQQVETGMGKDMDQLRENIKGTPTFFESQEGIKEADPVHLKFFYHDGVKDYHEVGFHVKKDSSLTIIMDYQSEKSKDGLAAVQTKIVAEENSKVCLVQIQRLGEGFQCMNDVGVVCEDGAEFDVIHLILGGKDTYLGCRTNLHGQKSSMNAQIGYQVLGNGKLDMNYVADHRGKRTISDIKASGILNDHGFKLFRGTIDFKKGASGAKGNEKEDVLLLDDHVVNQTIPLILCAEEDVEGNHGATIGKLDEEDLFYMQSRGLTEEEIYRMMAKARISAVCQKIPDEKTRDEILRNLEEGVLDEA